MKPSWILLNHTWVFADRYYEDASVIDQRKRERYQNTQNLEQIASKLVPLLKREKKILEILLSEDENGRNQVEIVIDRLQESVDLLEGFKKFDSIAAASGRNAVLRKYGIRKKDLIDACRACITFLALSRADLYKIEKRVASEEKFISNPTEAHIKGFIKAWDMEVVANQRLTAHLELVLNKTVLTKRKFLTNALKRALSSVQSEKSSEGSNAIGALLSILSFMGNLGSEFNKHKVIELDREDEHVLRGLERLRKIKIHWWNRL